MATDLTPLPEGLETEIAEVLRHFYDYPYLQRHPLRAHLPHLLGGGSAVAVQRLRTLLLQTLETLKPSTDLPCESQAYRPYQVVYSRYVLGNTLEEVEAELGLSSRQIQREQQRAFTEIANRVWAAEAAKTEGGRSSSEGSPLAREAERAASRAEAFDVAVELLIAESTIRALATSRGLCITVDIEDSPVLALADSPVFRQLLISVLSYLIRVDGASTIYATVRPQGNQVVCTLGAQGRVLSLSRGCIPPSVMNTFETLARAAGAEIRPTRPMKPIQKAKACMDIEVQLPAAASESTVAVIEDNKDLVTLYTRYMGCHGFRVVDVGDPSLALESLEACLPRAVVLDVMLSTVDGWQVLQSIRTHPDLRHIPVIVCSVLDEAELAASLGADAYLKKPVMPAQLLECVARLLTMRRRSVAGSP